MHAAALFESFDLPILRFLTGFAGRSHLIDHLINALSRMDIFKGVILMCLFWYIWANGTTAETEYAREQRQNRLILVLIGTVLIGGLSRGLQLILTIHQRPVLSDLGLNFPVTGFDAYSLNAWNSFPSDHAMFFFALGAGLWSVNRAAGLIACVWTVVVIDLPRIYLGIHYPSDVVFGAVLGFAAMQVLLALPTRRLERMVGAWRHRYPGLSLAVLFFVTDEIGHLLEGIRDLASSMHVLIY